MIFPSLSSILLLRALQLKLETNCRVYNKLDYPTDFSLNLSTVVAPDTNLLVFFNMYI